MPDTNKAEADSAHVQGETYNPWSIVNLVFRHLADEGLHPVLGESGDPGQPAVELLLALGITPAFQSRPHVVTGVTDELARLRQAFEARQGAAETAPESGNGR